MPDIDEQSLTHGEKSVMRKDIDFQYTYLRGLLKQFDESAGDGLLQQYEDLIDVMYAMFPSKHKRQLKIWNEELTEMFTIHEEWLKACKVGPRLNAEEVKNKDPNAMLKIRDRCLRKAQIVTDTAEKLKLIGEEFPDIEMTEEESEVHQMVNDLAR